MQKQSRPSHRGGNLHFNVPTLKVITVLLGTFVKLCRCQWHPVLSVPWSRTRGTLQTGCFPSSDIKMFSILQTYKQKPKLTHTQMRVRRIIITGSCTHVNMYILFGCVKSACQWILWGKTDGAASSLCVWRDCCFSLGGPPHLLCRRRSTSNAQRV